MLTASSARSLTSDAELRRNRKSEGGASSRARSDRHAGSRARHSFRPIFPRLPPGLWKSYPRSLVEGTECSPQASDDLMFSVSCGRKASCPYFPSSRRISPVIFTLPSIASVYAGAGLGRRSSISRRIFRNKSLGTAVQGASELTCTTMHGFCYQLIRVEASGRPSVVRRGGLETHGRGLLHCCAKQPVLSDQLR